MYIYAYIYIYIYMYIYIYIYRKIPLIRHGRIRRQRTNLMALYWRGGAYIREEKHFNLQSVRLITFLSFFQIF